jgi:uncharacterized repeat protein (TIGR01451 family)
MGRFLPRFLAILLFVTIALPLASQTPPYWNGGTPTSGSHLGHEVTPIKPVPWPATNQWVPYSWGTRYPDNTDELKNTISDPRVQDPSNGGTTPQNYVNVSSGCPDGSQPSIYYSFNPVTGIVFFRWRVEQIANTYATGPNAGSFSSSNPWNSALWTVFLSLTGNGYRNFAAHLDGSSGSPALPIDILRTVYSDTNNNVIDYLTPGSGIFSLFTNPTAFVRSASDTRITQFDGNAEPTTIQWPNGSSETVWDYGTSRSINISSGSCSEYFVDYQIPIAMLNATWATPPGGGPRVPLNGPVLTPNTPFQFLFATANSLQNPFQKDVVWEGSFVCNANAPAPFGDPLTLNHGIIPQPIATSIRGSYDGCSTTVSAQIMSALTVTNCQSISQLVSAQFKYWYDSNGDGLPNEPTGTWVDIGDPTVPVGTIVTANWNLANLIQGQYLLALEITDNRGHTTRTWEEKWTDAEPKNVPYGTLTVNDVTGGLYTNSPQDGLIPALAAATATIGSGAVTGITVTNGGTGFLSPPRVFLTGGGGTGATATATINASGVITGVTIATPGSGYTSAPTVSFSPNGTIGINYDIVSIGGTCGAPPPTVTKAASPAVVQAGMPATYTLRINNTSGTTVTVSQVTDTLPAGFTYVSTDTNASTLGTPTNSPTMGSGGTITWTFPNVQVPGGQQRTLVFTVNAGQSGGTFYNTATFATNVGNLSGTDTAGVSVRTASLIMTKTAANAINPDQPLSQGNTARFTITITNNSQTPVTNLSVSDPLPAGFNYLSSTASSATPAVQAPTVVFSGGGGIGARATAFLSPSGTVSSVLVTSGGSGYTTAPAVSFTSGGGSGATATATVSGGVVTAVTLNTPGAGYTTAPTGNATVSWRNQTIAANGGVLTYTIDATATLGGAHTNTVSATSNEAPTLSASASVFVSGPALTIVKNANVNVLTSPGPIDFSIQFANVGTQEATGLTFSDTPPPGFTLVTTAPTTAGCSQTGGAGGVVNCTLNPNTLAAGATRTVSLRFNVSSAPANVINSVTVTSTNAQTVSTTFPVQIISNSCSNSTWYFRSQTGSVDDTAPHSVAYVNMTASGANYAAVPTVGFGSGSGTGASGTAYGVTGAGGIFGVNITDGGSGYASNFPISFTGSGTGAAGTAVLTSNSQYLALTSPGNANNTIPAIGVKQVNNNTFGEVVRFYHNPADDTTAYVLDTTATVKLGFIITNTNPVKFSHRVVLAMYDPITESMIAVASGETLNYNKDDGPGTPNISVGVPFTKNQSLTIPAGTVLRAGWRLVWIIYANDFNGGNSTVDVQFLVDGASGPYQSSATLCLTPLRRSLTKTVDKLVATPGVETLTYTINYANQSTVPLRSATVTDVLPAGTTFASATAVATTGIHSATVTSGGSGYSQSTPPTVGFTGGGGTGAIGRTIVVGGSVVAVEILNSGSGYTSAPTITFTGGGGTGAVATAVRTGTVSPTVGTNGTVTFRLGAIAAGAVGSVSITVNTSQAMPGTSSTNTASFSGALSPTITASATTQLARANVQIEKSISTTSLVPGQSFSYTVNITNAGNGIATGVFATDPLPSFITPTGYNAVTDAVAAITVTGGGSGYTSVPTVNLSGGGGNGATAVAVLSGGSVSAIIVTNSGTNYTSAPAVSFSGGGGTGAVANATLRSVTPTCPGPSCTSGATVVYNVGTMLAGTSLSLVINSQVASAGVPAGQTNIVNTGSVIDGFNTTPRTASATATITANPALTISETATAPSRIAFINVTSGGSNYTSVPTVSVTGCTTAPTLLVHTNPVAGLPGPYTITGITVVDPGAGCVSPIVNFTGGGGSGASATAVAGPMPGDTITYTITVTNSGNADATGVLATGSIPSYTSWVSGGTYGGGTTVASLGTLAPGASGVLTYSVKVQDSLPYAYANPFGVTTLTATGTTSSTNAPAPANCLYPASGPYPCSITYSTGTSPWYTIAKSPDGAALPYPATTLSGTVTSSTALLVASASLLSAGDYIAVWNGSSYTITRINFISGNTLTIAPAISAAAGAPILLPESYSLSYANIGNATGTNISIRDVLPAGLFYAGVPAGAALPFSAPAVGQNNAEIVWIGGQLKGVSITNGGSGYTSPPTISFTGGGGTGATATASVVGGVLTAITITSSGSGYTSSPTVVITPNGGGSGAIATAAIIPQTLAPDATGSVEFLAFATAAGTYKNTALIRDGTGLNTRSAWDQAATSFGTLVPAKVTTIPAVTNSVSGTETRYILTITNPLPTTAAEGVRVTDILPAGFTYKLGSTVINGSPAADPCITINCSVTPAISGDLSAPVWWGPSVSPLPGGGTLTIQFDALISSGVPSGVYDNDVRVLSTTVPSLEFDYTATTVEDVLVCDPAPIITAPGPICGFSTGNVASVPRRQNANYEWSITNGTITNPSTGTIDRIVVGSGGTGYTAPTITITGGGGSGATATAVVSGGIVTAINMTYPGSGYTSAPTVTITEGGGSGATAVAVLGTGIVYSSTNSSPVTISLTVTEGGCSVSTSTQVTVTESPVITGQPQSKTVCGTSTSFTVAVTGATSIQWQHFIGGTWQNIAGATSATLNVTGIDGSFDGRLYRAIVANGSCSLTSAVATLNVGCNIDLTVPTNTPSAATVIAGQTVTFTQTVGNLASESTGAPITFTQSIPAGTTFISMTPPAGWSCTTPAPHATSGTITCTNVVSGVKTDLAGNTTTGNFSLVLYVLPNTADGTTINLDAVVAAGTGDEETVLTNNNRIGSFTVQKRIENALVKTNNAFLAPYGAGYIYPGNPPVPQPLTWYIWATNAGPSTATNVVVSDPLPFGFEYSSHSVSQGDCTYNSGTRVLTCTLGTIAPTPSVTITGGGGTGATARAIVEGNVVTAVEIKNAGTGYTTTPTVTITTPAGCNCGGAATATAAVGGVVNSVTVNTGGTNYTSAPTVTFGMPGAGGVQAQGTANVSNGAVIGVTITNGGSGYASAPTVSFSGGGGSGATASSAISSSPGVTSFTVTNGGSGYNNTPKITINGTTTVDTTQLNNTATMSYSEVDTLASNDPSTGIARIIAPTLVRMFEMQAVQTTNSVTLTWQTEFETDNLGFHVYRQTPSGPREQVNRHIIPGGSLMTKKNFEGMRTYRFVDRNPKGMSFAQYWIEDVDLNGIRTIHGPITPVQATAAEIESLTASDAVTDPDPTLGSVGGIFTTAAGMGVAITLPEGNSSTRLAQQWQIAASSTGALIVTQPGWYRVRKSDLLAAGYDPGTASRSISVVTEGLEVPIEVRDGGDGLFDADDTIEFFGMGLDTAFTGGRVYYVTTVPKSSARMKTTGGKGNGAPAPNSFAYTFHRTERTVYDAALTSNGERENFFGAVVTSYPATSAVTVANLDPAGNNAQLEVVIQGYTQNFDHAVSIDLNGRNLGTARFRGQVRYIATYDVPVSWLVEGENAVRFVAVGGQDDVNVIETMRLTYPHLYRADSNALTFRVPSSAFVRVGGFTTNQVRVIDLTDPLAPTSINASIDAANDGTFTASFASGNGVRTFFAFGADRVLAPAQLFFNQPSKLNATGNGADLVIVTNKAFLPAANNLAAARNGQGIATVVVDVQDVYDEFSYGHHSPSALREFFKRSRAWSKVPRYAILLGDASFDPRNYLGVGSFDFVPTKLVATNQLKTSSDDWFADFDDTTQPQIAIGRIPARTLSEANAVVNKLVARGISPPSASWTQNVAVVADRVTSTVQFSKGADEIAAALPAGYTPLRVQFGSNATTSRTAVINAFNTGSVLMAYSGHGSVELWSNVFSSTHAGTLANGSRLPMVVAMNCLNGYFHDLYQVSLAEALLRNPNGGAIAVWASSSLTSPDQQHKVNLEFNRHALNGDRIGDAILKAKQATQDLDVRRSWILFGDPTIRLK